VQLRKLSANSHDRLAILSFEAQGNLSASIKDQYRGNDEDSVTV
jgi:hypothetical protein